jgi:hypothetical protein
MFPAIQQRNARGDIARGWIVESRELRAAREGRDSDARFEGASEGDGADDMSGLMVNGVVS